MGHILKSGMIALMALVASVTFAQQDGWAGSNPNLRAGNCTFFSLTPNPTPPTCNGINNGVAAVIVSGGVGPFTYAWIGGPTTPTWPNRGAGTYTVIVFDQGQGGAACNVDVFINEPGPITVFAMNAIAPTCFGACNGSAAPIIIGGAGGYVLNWSNGQNGFTANNLCNPFTLTITDASGCSTDTLFTFNNEPQEILFEAVTTDILCNGEGNGAIDLTILGGSPTFNLSWTGPNGFTSSSEDISNLSAGDYSISVTDQNNCSAQETFTIEEPDAIVVNPTIVENECAGDSIASITIEISGGIIDYSFIWSGPNGFSSNSQNISNLLSGTYNLQITDANNCVFNGSYEIIDIPEIQINLTTTDITCAGANDGTITTDITGGTGSYIVSWTGPNGFTSSNQNLSGLSIGSYTITVNDENGCIQTATAEITELGILSLTTNSTNITCAGANNGIIDLIISGGTPDYVISWTGPNGFTSNSLNLNGLQAGIYNVVVTDSNDCSETADVLIEEPDAIVLNLESGDVLCAGLDDGFINLTISGGAPDYVITWSGPNGFTSNLQNISNLGSGVYSVVVLDADNCFQTEQITINENDPIVLDATVVQPNCSDSNDGSIALSISGGNPIIDGLGNPIYIITWTGPNGFTSTASSISNLENGVYNLLVQDDSGCENSATYEIIAPDSIQINGAVTAISCIGEDGAIDLIITGGTPAYNFAWTGPNGYNSISQNISALLPGTYNVIVTDNNSCSASATFEVNDVEPIEITETISNVLCQGVSNGAISLVLIGGELPLTFQWTGPNGFTSIDQDITGLDAGSYSIVITDAFGCATNASFLIIEEEGITVEGIITDADCVNNNDGSILTNIFGGTAPYSTFWLGPNGFTSSDPNIFNLEAGIYTYVVTDAADCYIEQPFVVANPSDFEVTETITNLLCNGDANGSIAIEINGAIAQTISWSGPNGFTSNNQNIDNLSGGVYTLTLTDENDCVFIATYEVIEPTALDLSIITTQPTCNLNNGQIVSAVSGGTPAYDYVWTNQLNEIVGTGTLINNLGAGIFTITVTDLNNCVSTQTITLVESDLIVDAVITPITCGNNDGAIEITINGGVSPFQINWSGPNGFVADTEDIFGLSAGTYNLNITDDTGCITVAVYDVLQANPIIIDITSQDILCFGQNNGSITAAISGGVPDYNVNWSGPNGFTSSSLTLVNLSAGVYDLTVEDSDGCIETVSVEILETNEIIVSEDITQISCGSEDNGAINISITGGALPYLVTWTGPNGFSSNNPNIANLESGNYTLIILDDNNCVFTDTYTIDAFDAINADAVVTPAGCLGQNAGTITLTITGGIEPYVTSWTGPNGFTSNAQIITDLEAGDYDVVITDDNGCVFNQNYQVLGSIPLVIEAELGNVFCQGVFDGFINLTLSGGSPDFEFLWSGPNGFNASSQNISDLGAGDYTVIITDGLGCITTETYNLFELEGITVEAEITDASCDTNDDGEISVTISGGTPGYSTFWLGPNGYTNSGTAITGLEAGVYTFVVTDAADCYAEIPFIVNNPSAITIDGDITHILCSGDNNGAIDITLIGAVGTETFSWTGPNGFISNNEDISDLSAGMYTLSVVDDALCLVTQIFEVFEPQPLQITLSITQPSCGLNNGQINASIDGGTPDYVITWTDIDNNVISNNASITNLAPGIYTISVIDENGCVTSEMVELINTELIVDITSNNLLCFEDNSGTISLNILGGTQPYTVSWTGPNGFNATNPNLSGLEAGTYILLIQDDSGCSAADTIEILQPELLTLSATGTPSTCGQNNGTLSATIAGGTAIIDYTISWIDANNTEVGNSAMVTGVSAGIYTVIVTDDNGCQVSDLVSISDEDGSIDGTVQLPSCSIGNDGSIQIIVNGGTMPYLFSWTGPNGFIANSQNIFNLEAGVYTVTVTDFTGCVFTEIFDLTVPITFELNFNISAPTCAGDTNGIVTMEIIGGVAPYVISWTGPNGFISDQQNLNDLSAGTYNVLVFDSLNCSNSAEIELLEPAAISALLEVTNNVCATDTIGAINVTVSGGTSPYTFQWVSSNGFTSDQQNISGLAAGFYELLITDSIGCTAMLSETVLSSPLLGAEFTSVSPNCYGDFTGQINTTVTGGTPGYNYTWTGPNGFSANTSAITNLEAGNYSLSIVDTNFCSIDTTFTLLQPDSLYAAISSTNVLCFGDNNGTIDAQIIGGTEPYTFTWNGPNGFTSPLLLLSDLEPGLYGLNILDTNGCSFGAIIPITTPDSLYLESVAVVDALCNTDNSGSIETNVVGGTQPFNFSWSGPDQFVSENQNINNLFPGTYNLMVTDSNGCFAQLVDSVGFTFEINADAGIDQSVCENNQPFVLQGTNINALSVEWLDEQGNVLAENDSIALIAPVGTYTYYYAVSNGLCTDIDSVVVTILPQPIIDPGLPITIYEGDETTLGGNPVSPTGVFYSWTNGSTLNDSTLANPTAMPVTTTLYTITVTDNNGCTNFESVLITVIPEIHFPSGVTPNGDGINDTWIIDYIELYPNNVVEIYNRWGDRLYRAEGYDNTNGWDGYYNGKALPVGTYYFVVELKDERYPEPFTGPITIFR